MLPNRKELPHLDEKKLIKKGGFYNITYLKSHLSDEGILKAKSMKDLITKCIKILQNEPNIMEISGPIWIIGDIHGQYYDFMKILSLIGNIEQSLPCKLLFLGDYVDRGANSVEVITLILALKLNYPKDVILLRGNHESRCMTNTYNFMKETLDKYDQDIFDCFMGLFDCLPLACIVNKKFFCVHGGISDKITTVKEIMEIDRFREIPLDGPFCDYIWSDPINKNSGDFGKEVMFNDSRQCSIYFGKSLTQNFLEQNKLKSIIRAHQVFEEGYKSYFWGDNKKIPSVLTVFSAPNYCGSYGNKGAIIKIDESEFKIRQYNEQTIHNKLHEYLQVFQWSIPEITRVINQFTNAMMHSIYQIKLKGEFPKFAETSPEVKMKVLQNYIHKNTDIEKMQKMRSSVKLQKKPKPEDNEKERVFNRSHDYYLKEHARPK